MHTAPTALPAKEADVFLQGPEMAEDFYDPNNPNGWADEALGYNCKPLRVNKDSPKVAVGWSIVKTLPPVDVSVADHEGIKDPIIEGYSTVLNHQYQQVSTGSELDFVIMRPLMFLYGVTGPFLFFFFIALCIAAVNKTDPLDGGDIATIVGAFLLSLVTLYFLQASIRGLNKIPYRIDTRFCRATQKIYCLYFEKGKAPFMKAFPWKNCRAQIVRMGVTTGVTVGRVTGVLLNIVDPKTNTVTDALAGWGNIPIGDISFQLRQWEAMRRYMQYETKEVSLVVNEWPAAKNWLDCLDRVNPFHLLFSKRSLLGRMFGQQAYWQPTTHWGWKVLKVFDIPLCIALWCVTPLALYFASFRALAIRLAPKLDWSSVDKECEPEPGTRAAEQMAQMRAIIAQREIEDQARNKTKRKWLWLWLGSYAPWALLFIGAVIKNIWW